MAIFVCVSSRLIIASLKKTMFVVAYLEVGRTPGVVSYPDGNHPWLESSIDTLTMIIPRLIESKLFLLPSIRPSPIFISTPVYSLLVLIPLILLRHG